MFLPPISQTKLWIHFSIVNYYYFFFSGGALKNYESTCHCLFNVLTCQVWLCLMFRVWEWTYIKWWLQWKCMYMAWGEKNGAKKKKNKNKKKPSVLAEIYSVTLSTYMQNMEFLWFKKLLGKFCARYAWRIFILFYFLILFSSMLIY